MCVFIYGYMIYEWYMCVRLCCVCMYEYMVCVCMYMSVYGLYVCMGIWYMSSIWYVCMYMSLYGYMVYDSMVYVCMYMSMVYGLYVCIWYMCVCI